MQTKLLRTICRKFGAVGLLVVGCYLVLHTIWQRRRLRYVAFLFPCIGVAVLLLFGTHQRHLATIAPIQNDHTLVANLTQMSHQPAQAYTITDLGVMPGYLSSTPYCINDSGQVVGICQGIDYSHRLAVLWKNGHMCPLSEKVSEAHGINNKGQIVGVQKVSAAEKEAVLWQNGNVQRLAKLPDFPSEQSEAISINDRGQIVGNAMSLRGRDRVCLWESGKIRAIIPEYHVESNSVGSINAYGQIALTSHTGDYDSVFPLYHAMCWDPKRGLLDLGTLHGQPKTNSWGMCINDAGTVVGSSEIQTNQPLVYHAFRWRNEYMEDLGVLMRGDSSFALGINNAGTIVGYEANAEESKAVIWSGRIMTNLTGMLPPGSGWKLRTATSINNRGQIVGFGVKGNAGHAYLLTPK